MTWVLLGVLAAIITGSLLLTAADRRPGDIDRRTATRRAEGLTAWTRIGGGGG